MLESSINQLQKYIKDSDQINLDVSKVSVGWHLHHSLKVIDLVLTELKTSDPLKFQKKINFLKLFLFAINRFPRGKAKAPKIVVPSENLDQSALDIYFMRVKIRLEEIDSFDQNSFFKHPFFGHISKNETLKFLNIHTKHHLLIINDINKRKKR